MKADTRLFGEIDIEEQKIIHMENGMIGFPELKKFALIYDEEKKKKEPKKRADKDVPPKDGGADE